MRNIRAKDDTKVLPVLLINERDTVAELWDKVSNLKKCALGYIFSYPRESAFLVQ